MFARKTTHDSHTLSHTLRRHLLAFAPLLFIAAGHDDLSSRRAEMERLTPSELQAVREKWTRFEKLDKTARDQIKTLHSELSKLDAASREELLTTMDRFAEWLKTLSTAQRDRIQSARTAEDRLIATEQIMKEQAARFEKDLAALKAKAAGDSDAGARNAPFVPRRRDESIGDRTRVFRIRNTGFNFAVQKATELEIAQVNRAERLGITAKYVASCALVAKYPVNNDVKEQFAEILREIPLSFWESKLVRDGFAGHDFDKMTPSERARFLGVLIFAFSIEPTDEAVLFRDSEKAKLNSADPKQKEKDKLEANRDRAKTDLLAEVTSNDSKVLASLCNTLLNLLYVYDHRDSLAPEQKQHFEQLLNGTKPESNPPLKRKGIAPRIRGMRDAKLESEKKQSSKNEE